MGTDEGFHPVRVGQGNGQDSFGNPVSPASCVGNAGTLTTNYLTFQGGGPQPRLRIIRSFVVPPNQPFLLVRYSFTNPTWLNAMPPSLCNDVGGGDASY